MTIVSTAELTNPGAEDGSTGWTSDLGTSPDTSASGPHSGSNKFVLDSNASFAAYFQDYTLPTDVVSATAVGAILVNPAVWQNDFASDTDNQRFRVHMWNANSQIVQTIRDPFFSGRNGTWTIRSLEVPLHPDTRKIRLYTDGIRFSGTELSAYQDDYSITFLANSEFRFDIGLLNPSAYDCTSFAFNPAGGADPANWVVKSGNLTADYQGKSVENNLHNVTSYFFRSVDSATLMATQVVCLTNVFSIYDAIDTGSIEMTLSYLQGLYNASIVRAGFMRVDFLSGSGTQVGSMEDTWKAASTYWENRSVVGVVPTLTRRFEISMISSGESASFDGNCWFSNMEAYLMLNSNYVDGNNDPFAGPSITGKRDFPRVVQRDFPTTALRDFPVIPTLLS